MVLHPQGGFTPLSVTQLPTLTRRLSLLVIGYGNHPSSRLRILQFLPQLHQAGIHSEVILCPSGQEWAHADFGKSAAAADVIFVQRVVSKQLVRALRSVETPVIFDFDDALHYVRYSQLAAASTWGQIRSTLKCAYRTIRRGGPHFASVKPIVEDMISLSRLTIVGNEWLGSEFVDVGAEIVVIPTCVPVEPEAPKSHIQKSPVRLGWVGLKDNLFELDSVAEALDEVHVRHGEGVMLTVSSSRSYTPRSLIRCENLAWSVDEEPGIVRSFDVGLMPLRDIPFARGKCAFKALLCMSHGIPVVASPVGANSTVIRNGWNGFLASTAEEWASSLSALVGDEELRARLGANAFETVRERYAPRVGLEKLHQAIASTAS
jgi:glycosyltransferase involved in cell wall biosynthesis